MSGWTECLAFIGGQEHHFFDTQNQHVSWSWCEHPIRVLLLSPFGRTLVSIFIFPLVSRGFKDRKYWNPEQTHVETWIDFFLSFLQSLHPARWGSAGSVRAFVPPPTLISSHLFRLHFRLVRTHTLSSRTATLSRTPPLTLYALWQQPGGHVGLISFPLSSLMLPFWRDTLTSTCRNGITCSWRPRSGRNGILYRINYFGDVWASLTLFYFYFWWGWGWGERGGAPFTSMLRGGAHQGGRRVLLHLIAEWRMVTKRRPVWKE